MLNHVLEKYCNIKESKLINDTFAINICNTLKNTYIITKYWLSKPKNRALFVEDSSLIKGYMFCL